MVLAFGSCSHEFDTAQMWNTILKNKPDAWIWLGDIVYGDTYDMSILKSKYELQKSRPSYQKLMSNTNIFGIWDDHDFGTNDGGKAYPQKDESKKLLLNFLEVSDQNPVWNRDGAYQSYLIDQNGIKIKLILLDTRYFRDSLINNPDAPPRYLPNLEGSILGDQQWLWLEEELTNSEADIHLIASSIQVIPTEQEYEKWDNFPAERQRLFDLISSTKPRRPILISGDRHMAEFSKIELDGFSQPLYEFTSSGLTHTWSQNEPEQNSHRVGSMVIKKNFGLMKIKKRSADIEMVMEIRGPANEVLEKIELKL